MDRVGLGSRDHLSPFLCELAEPHPILRGERKAMMRRLRPILLYAIVELFWADRETMEAAWASPEGQAATADLAEFADLSRTTWSLVDFRQRR